MVLARVRNRLGSSRYKPEVFAAILIITCVSVNSFAEGEQDRMDYIGKQVKELVANDQNIGN